MHPKSNQIIDSVNKRLHTLHGHTFNVFSLAKPTSVQEAINLSKIISKLSPLVGNLIEFKMIEHLNEINEYPSVGFWKRQDPGFPDAIFDSQIRPAPGFEIKAWFPLATEITARFKDSQNFFTNDQTYMLLIAWLPENLLYGCPKIVDVCSISGKTVAKARDDHYHNPPDYLVMEPGDTSDRTANLQQTNTNGYKFQGTGKELDSARKYTEKIRDYSIEYKPIPQYQEKNRLLMEKYEYRLDTNYAKIDRIEHKEIEDFKNKVLKTIVNGLPIEEWARLICNENEQSLSKAFRDYLSI